MSIKPTRAISSDMRIELTAAEFIRLELVKGLMMTPLFDEPQIVGEYLKEPEKFVLGLKD